jgi:hypothetical protein
MKKKNDFMNRDAIANLSDQPQKNKINSLFGHIVDVKIKRMSN